MVVGIWRPAKGADDVEVAGEDVVEREGEAAEGVAGEDVGTGVVDGEGDRRGAAD